MAGIEAPDLEFWNDTWPSNCTLAKLQVVKMTDLFGVPSEMEFAKFLLENSPVLETLSITPSAYVTKDGRIDMLIEFVRFRRASPLAEVIFTED